MPQKKPIKKNVRHKDTYVVGRTLSTYSSRRPVNTRTQKTVPTKPIPEEKVRKKFSWKLTIALLIFIILLPFIIIGSWNAVNLSRASKKMFGNGNLLAALVPASLNGSERERINVLIVGYSADDPGHEGAKLTDSLMILSMSTKDKNSYMLNIPRDLYVTIPNSGRAKINEAYQRGELEGYSEPGYPAGGIGLLEQTVSESMGVPIDYFALVNYAAVRETTDAVGGITVNIQSTDPRGIYDPNFQPHEGGPLQLPNGIQKIDGQTALRLTRARGAAGGYGFKLSDFDRSRNQQEVFRAIKEAMTTGLLLNPQKNGRVLDAMASNVRTDIEINEVLPLYRLFKSIPAAELETVSLHDVKGRNLLANYYTPGKQAALVPAEGRSDFSEIQKMITELNQ